MTLTVVILCALALYFEVILAALATLAVVTVSYATYHVVIELKALALMRHGRDS